MSEHKAKEEVLKELGDDLRITFKAYMETLRFKLQGKGLISEDARDNKDAGKMVSDIQFRAHGDAALWDKLLEVLDGMPIGEDLLLQWSKKTGTARKFKTKVKF